MSASPSLTRDLLERDRLEAIRLQRLIKSMTLEMLFTHPGAFGVTTATPLQRAICRVADGQPIGDLATHPDVVAAMGDVTSLRGRPRRVLVLAAIRTAKSLMAATIATRAAMTCDLSALRPGETPRVSVISLDKDKARAVFDHLVGTLTSKPALRGLMMSDPTSDAVTLRHPSGKPVEVMVVAGSKAGGSLVARWSAGCIFDEAPRMNGEEDGVVNYDDAYRAVVGRLLPGAQIIDMGSPWAPRGPIYDAVQEFWKKPSESLVVVRGTGPTMNPYWWTPERCEALRQTSEQAYKTDVLGEFADAESTLIPQEQIERATRPGPAQIARVDGHQYVAAMDPAVRRNAWTLIVCTRRHRPEDGKQRLCVVLAKQWIPTAANPLDAETVVAEIAAELRGYGLEQVWTDQWASDVLRSIGRRHGLNIVRDEANGPRRVEMYESLRTRFADDGIEIPDVPVLRQDILGIRKRVTMSGLAIELPRTADGRHADFAPALSLAASKGLADGPVPVKSETAADRMARLVEADRNKWAARDERYEDLFRRQQHGDWIDAMEEMVRGE